jgi:hypothetical protein
MDVYKKSTLTAYLELTPDGKSIIIKNGPNAKCVVKLGCHEASRLAGFSQHRWDLQFANDTLESINLIPVGNVIVREALWRSAIVHYAKCFGNSKARFQLDVGKTHKGLDRAKEFNAFICDLRHKTIAHDESPICESTVGAILNDSGVEAVDCITIFYPTLVQENFSNLILLVKSALAFVAAEIAILRDRLVRKYAAMSYGELSALPPLLHVALTYKDVSRTKS